MEVDAEGYVYKYEEVPLGGGVLSERDFFSLVCDEIISCHHDEGRVDELESLLKIAGILVSKGANPFADRNDGLKNLSLAVYAQVNDLVKVFLDSDKDKFSEKRAGLWADSLKLILHEADGTRGDEFSLKDGLDCYFEVAKAVILSGHHDIREVVHYRFACLCINLLRTEDEDLAIGIFNKLNDLDGLVCADRYPRGKRSFVGWLDVVEVSDDVEELGDRTLDIALNKGYFELAKVLIEAGAKGKLSPLESQDTPLHIAARYGRLDVLESLIEKGAMDDEPNFHGLYAVHLAAEGGYADFLFKLLLLHKDEEGYLEKEDNYSFKTPLNYAANNGHLEAVKFLVDRGADMHCMCRIDSDYGFEGEAEAVRNSFILASRAGHHSVVKFFLEKKKCKPAEADLDDNTALLYAVQNGDHKMMSLLLSDQRVLGSVNDRCGPNYAPLIIYAIVKNDLEAVRILSSHGTQLDFDYEDSDEKTSSLVIAVENGSCDMLKSLLVKGADVNFLESDTGGSPLHAAIRSGDVAMAKVLLEHKANICLEDSKRKTPDYYVREGDEEMRCLINSALLEKGLRLEEGALPEAVVRNPDATTAHRKYRFK